MESIPDQVQEPSYRESYLSKGREYHAEFTENLRRALIWSIEKRVLSDISRRFIPIGNADHLNFACGAGRILEHFQGQMRSSTALAVSASMLRVAKELVPQPA